MPRRYTKEVIEFLVCQKCKVEEYLGTDTFLFSL
jgi:hypothetical protein